MPVFKLKNPCVKCPFRRDSLAGYLGEDEPIGFLRSTVLGEGNMPCHMTIDYGDPDWKQTQLPGASLCAGALAFMANSFHMPRPVWLYNAVRAVGRNAQDVFEWPWEFLIHHGKMDSQTARRRSAEVYQREEISG